MLMLPPTGCIKRPQMDEMEKIRTDFSIPRDFVHQAESFTDWTDSPSYHRLVGREWDEMFDQSEEIVQSHCGIQKRLSETIGGLDLYDAAFLRLRKTVASAMDIRASFEKMGHKDCDVQ